MRTKIVGILNITPDSFSDGGLYESPKNALIQARKMLKQGASIIDIGGESTRPNATPLTAIEEWQRVEPVLKLLKILGKKTQISLDTRHSENAEKAINLGVDWINDVSGCESLDMIAVLKNAKCKIVIMHNLGIPADPDITIDQLQDSIKIIYQWAENKISQLTNAGIDKSRIIFDPGIGFGKSAEQSLMIIQSIACFKLLDVPLYVGHSRKSFLGLLEAKIPSKNKDIATHTVSAYLAKSGVDYLRVHDIKGNLKAMKNP